MNIEETILDGVFVLTPKVYTDDRGYFMENYKLDFIKDIAPDFKMVQENISRSKKNVFRGIHLQEYPYSQAKLVQCIEGSIIDIVVDLRIDSPQYLKYCYIELSSDNKKQIFIPRGFGHAFFVKSDNATIMYKVDNVYNASSERTVGYSNRDINIDFQSMGIDPSLFIMSDKDREASL